MARISMHLDSATAEEARSFLLAFQLTRSLGLPPNGQKDLPTVEMMGIGWHINTPPMGLDRAHAMGELISRSTE